MQSYTTHDPQSNDLDGLVGELVRTARKATGPQRWKAYEQAKRSLSAACCLNDGPHADRRGYETLLDKFVREARI